MGLHHSFVYTDAARGALLKEGRAAPGRLEISYPDGLLPIAGDLVRHDESSDIMFLLRSRLFRWHSPDVLVLEWLLDLPAESPWRGEFPSQGKGALRNNVWKSA